MRTPVNKIWQNSWLLILNVLLIDRVLSSTDFHFMMSIWCKIILCSYQILFKSPITFNQIFSQTLDERSLELKMQYIVCISFANTVNTVNQKQKGCLRIIRVAIDRYETFTNECNLYIFPFFFCHHCLFRGTGCLCTDDEAWFNTRWQNVSILQPFPS